MFRKTDQRLPPTEALECFIAASRAPSFRQAARLVHLSPAAFGQRIQQIEDYVGHRLFVRGPRRAELTDAGRRLLPRVGEILNEVRNWPTFTKSSSAEVPRRVTLGTRHELGLSWLNPMISRLEQSVPGLRVDLHFGSGDELLRLLEAGDIDAVVSSSLLPTRRFAFELLHEERYFLVASPGQIKGQHIKTLDSLREQLLVDTHPGLPLAKYWLDADPAHAHVQFGDIRYLGAIGAIRDFVIQSEGIAVLPEYFVEGDIKSKKLRRLFPSKRLLSDRFRLVFLAKHRDAEVFRTLADVMRAMPLR